MDLEPSFRLTQAQLAVVEAPQLAKIFLEGPAGCGKTTVGVERLLALMAQGIPGNTILLLVPQRTLAQPYIDALHHPGVMAGGMVDVLTVGGLAQRMVDLFWPMVAEQAGFAHSDRPPSFLTMETAQYFMAHLLRPRLDQGLFESVTIDRNRLYSQVIDNLNKAAVVGFSHSEIGERLKSAWVGEPGQLRIYEDVQTSVDLFREYCLAHNLLDFSLQLELFWQHLWPMPVCRDYLLATYQHLIADNLEEDTPISHDLLRQWMPDFTSALMIYDWQAGFRRFLGADPDSAYSLKASCSQQAVLEYSMVTTSGVRSLGEHLALGLQHPAGAEMETSETQAEAMDPRSALAYEFHRFYPEMLDWVSGEIDVLVHNEGVAPSEIVVLAPYLSDALRFSLSERLAQLQIASRSHRPSRSLREEPATQCLLTLSMLAHPEWGFLPTKFDVAYALVQAVEGMDLIRAQLLAEIVYRVKDGLPSLSSFEQIKPEVQERITYQLGRRYEQLRLWLSGHFLEHGEAFDHFLSRMFGELLSQPGFGFHADYDAGEVAANLVESVQKFRWVAEGALDEEGQPLGKEFLLMVQDGVIAAQYIRSWQVQPGDAVLLAPAYTFLMSNRPVSYQFWLDVGSRGWVERLYQPLTHPYVLSRAWPAGQVWNDSDEVETSREALFRLTRGLLRRCRWKIFLGLSELGEQGFEQRGGLLQAFQRVLRQTPEVGG